MNKVLEPMLTENKNLAKTRCVANGSPPLLRFFGAVLPTRYAAEIAIHMHLFYYLNSR